MSDATGEGWRRRGRSRPWWSPGPRVWVEAAVLVAAAAGLVVVRERNEFPRPLIRDLRGGTAAGKAEALRGLALFGRAGDEAIPTLLRALREDPSPTVRRGSAFVLASIVTAGSGGEPFSLDLFLAGTEAEPAVRSADGQAPSPPHPRAGAVADGLARSIATDPDPTVRCWAILALGDVLDAALGLQPPEPARLPFLPPGEPKEEPEPAFGVEPWMRAVAGAIADRAGSTDLAEARLAAAWTYTDPAARVLIDDDGRADALLSAASVVAQGPEDYLDVLIVQAAALAARSAPDRRAGFLDALDRATATPPPAEGPAVPEGRPVFPFWAGGPSARPLHPDEHAVPFLMAGPSARELAEHPGAIAALGRLIGRDAQHAQTYTSSGSRGHAPPFEDAFRLRLEAERRPAGLQSRLNPLERMIFDAVRDDPAILDLLADRLGAGPWSRLLDTRAGWNDLIPVLIDPARRTTLPPDRAGEVIGGLLDLVEAGPPPEGPGRQTARPDPSSWRERGLALLSFFVRGPGTSAEEAGRFARLVDSMTADPDPERRERGRRLLEGVAIPSASP